MLRGLTTINFFADDLSAARDWYTELLGVEPYFVREIAGAPAYIEFRLGDYQHELGFIDRKFAPPGQQSGGQASSSARGTSALRRETRSSKPSPAEPARTANRRDEAMTYWAVDDVQAAFDRLLSLGATVHQEVREQGPGFVTASVVDPFGNVLGVMYNQHFLDVLGGQSDV
jgi:predicted enzyme related to lactoylglutathione lyase